MKIRTKLIIPVFLLLGLLLGSFLYILIYVSSQQSIIKQSTQQIQKINDISFRIYLLRQESDLNLISYRYNQENEILSVLANNDKQIDELLNVVTPVMNTDMGMELLSTFTNSRLSLLQNRQYLIEAIQKNKTQETNELFYKWKILSENSNTALLDFTNYNLRALEKSELQYQQLVDRIVKSAIMFTLLSIAVVLLMYLFFRKIITKPIQELSLAAERMAQGKFNRLIVVKSKDELGTLAENLNVMADNLQHYYESLRKQVSIKEEEIRKTKEFEKQKDNFMNIASHELKTPVTSLKLFVQLMQQQTKKTGNLQYDKYLEKMATQITRLTNLITSLLDVTKVHAGKLPLEKVYFDMNAVLEESIENVKDYTNKHTIILKGKVKNSIFGDPDRLSQVLDNLLSNAVKYSPEGGRIIITVQHIGDNLVISITDSGIGIDEKHHKKIFERFFRVSEVTERKFEGLGIGLYFSYEVVRSHNGTIKVESKKGKGSTFTIVLPLVTSHNN